MPTYKQAHRDKWSGDLEDFIKNLENVQGDERDIIPHPDKPGGYILGVECDGASYHCSKSVRDRDQLRQDVLADFRVWSTGWYRDPEREFV